LMEENRVQADMLPNNGQLKMMNIANVKQLQSSDEVSLFKTNASLDYP